MICSVHQPNYIPYCGFFEKAFRSDIFIIYDSTQFKKNDWQNRNRICVKGGWEWLTIPVINNFGQKIFETKIDLNQNPLKKNWQTIKTVYGNAPYFKQYSGDFEKIYRESYKNIAELNYDIIKLISSILGLETKFICNTTLRTIETKSTEALIDLCKLVDADTYISGASGINYLDISLFDKENIKIIFQNYNHPKYIQFNSNEFQPNMSVIDLIFNCGPDSLKILCSDQSY